MTCAIEQHPRTTEKDARDAEGGPARRDSVCGARRVSVPAEVWGPRFGKTTFDAFSIAQAIRLPRLPHRMPEGWPGCRRQSSPHYRVKFPAASENCTINAELIWENATQISTNRVSNHSGCNFLPLPALHCTRLLTLQRQTPRRAGAFAIAALRSGTGDLALSAWPSPARRGWRRR